MDNKIYELMAQAEILQEHALELQNKASEAIFEIPEAIDQAKRKLGSTAILSACIWVIFGIVAILAVWIMADWVTDNLREEKNRLKWEISGLKSEAERLRKEIKDEEKKLAKVQSWGIELVENKGQRWIMLGKGDHPGEKVIWDDKGRTGIQVIRKK